ncbi:MAG: hypothetical protein SynsKO_28860 [Synoicihabitans sp.]
MSRTDPVSAGEAAARLESCRLFDGAVQDFWPLFARTCADIGGAVATRVVVKADESWKLAAAYPNPRDFPAPMHGSSFEALAKQALMEGLAAAPAEAGQRAGLLLVALATGNEDDQCLLAAAIAPGSPEDLADAGVLLRLAADTPLLYQRQRQLERSRRDVENFTQALEILAVTNLHTRFLGVAMALVNEVATRHHCSRVSLGWHDGAYIRIKAVSGTDNFEKKMTSVQKLEAAMEEARDQDEEIIWPASEHAEIITRDHKTYAELEQVTAMLSVPVRIDGEVKGVLMLERGDGFTEFDALALRVISDQVARRLEDLRINDRWFGARWASSWREGFSKFLGPQNTWWKVAGVMGALFLAFSIFVPLPYRVNATFIVRAEQLAHLPASYDGYLAAAHVRPGDMVKAGQELVRLDTSDLLVELSSALAEKRRYAAEAEKAEADRQLADMRAFRALEAQADAQVDLVQYRLDRASLKAPFDGIVVEGDLRERLGAPVRAGDVMMRVSRLDGLYVQMDVPERDIDLIAESETAEIAFTTRPEDTFAVDIERIEPAAVVDNQGNYFVVRGRLQNDAEWLRPGMTGVAKIEAGKRNFMWIATHRLIDFVRLKFWW